jgi:hypothetical protein
VFIMISSHFPTVTYGHTAWGNQKSWLLLILVMIAGAAFRAFMNLGRRWLLLAVGAALATALVLTVPPAERTRRARRARSPVPAAELTPIDPATTGTIHGVVTLAGAAPARERLALVAECAARHDGAVYSDAVLAEGGKLQNAFVWIRAGHERWAPPPPPADPVVIDQQGCLYTPRVVGARVDQPVAVLNSDPLLHNVHAVADANATFNLAMATSGTRNLRRFDEPEVMVQLKCDVHPWMHAYIGVVDHPWFAVTGADGAFSLGGVPPGDYEFEVWHEVFGRRTGKATVAAGATAELALELSAGD